jgi:hypothetical protein
VKIHDATANLYFNGTGWQAAEAWLLCTFDVYDQWIYDTENIWPVELGHTFHVMAHATDECGNVGKNLTI